MNTKTMFVTLMAIGAVGLFATSSSVHAYRGDPSVTGPNCTAERHAAMQKAFESNDFNAWKKLMVGKGRVTRVINAQNFAKFAQAHKLAQEGKLEEARKIREELGLGLHNGSGMGQYGKSNR